MTSLESHEMTSPAAALRLALRDFYANSWRLVPVNAALGAVLVLTATAALAVPAAALLVVLAGPIAAALVHCSVTLVRTGNLTLGETLTGLRRHWRRGLALAAVGASLLGLGVLAIRFYSRSPYGWTLAFLALYLLVVIGVYQVVLWTIAIAEPERPLRGAARQAAVLVTQRPGATAAFGLGLLAVNVAGFAAALMPFLTVTISYSFVAAAHFALAPPTSKDVN